MPYGTTGYGAVPQCGYVKRFYTVITVFNTLTARTGYWGDDNRRKTAEEQCPTACDICHSVNGQRSATLKKHASL
ncbi:hypothetical protein ACFOGG_10645 [Brenneria rubrifaciens]|uniref:hypothetical protein n=1 Tax=Brenneria rubrifaciens TaxID=55213 RepID=UPI0036151584